MSFLTVWMLWGLVRVDTPALERVPVAEATHELVASGPDTPVAQEPAIELAPLAYQAAEGVVLDSREEVMPDNHVVRTSLRDYGRPDLPVLRVEKGHVRPDGEFESDAWLEMAAHRILVTTGPGMDPDILQRAFPGTTIRPIDATHYALASMEFDLDTVPELLEAALESGLVMFAEPDYVLRPSLTPNDPSFSQLWALNNTGQTGGSAGADISAVDAWSIRNDAGDRIIAIIDSGVRLTHADLASNLWRNLGEVADGVDNDNNGVIDDIHGYNTVLGNGSVNDDEGHGTHVAGIAAAVGNNGQGISGVAWRAQIMPVKFIVEGLGSTYDAILAIDYAADEGADVINASWGGPGNSFSLAQAILRAGVPFVAAAGNDAANNDLEPSYPANYDLDNVVSVGSSDHRDSRSSFSNYGQQNVDLFAPGSNIYSTWYTSNTAYTPLSGTSMATPQVTGALALIASHYPGDSSADWISRLLTSVDRPAALAGFSKTGGRLNLQAALGQSSSVIPPFIEVGLSDRQVASGSDVTFSVTASGTAPLNYAWYRGGALIAGETSSSLTLNDVTTADEGLYQVTVSNEAGVASSSANLSVFDQDVSLGVAFDDESHSWFTSGDAPWLVQTHDVRVGESALVSGSIDDLESSSLQTTVTGPGLACFRWRVSSEWYYDYLDLYIDGIRHGGISGITDWQEVCVEIPEGEHTLTWTYSKDIYFTYGNDAGYLDGFSFSGLVDSAPRITSAPQSQVMSPGSTVRFEVQAESDEGAIYYQWFRDGSQLGNSSRVSGVESSRLTIANVQSFDAGLYYVEVGNDAGTVSSSRAQLTVSGDLPPTIITQPEGVTLGIDEDLVLTPIVSGSEPITYRWLRDGEFLAGNRSRVLTLNGVTQDDSGEYQLEASNDAGTILSDPAQVLIIEATIVPVFHKHPVDAYAGVGEEARFQVQVGGTEPISLQWYKDDEPIADATGDEFVIEPVNAADSGQYWVEATNEFGTVTSRSATLVVLGSANGRGFALGVGDTGLLIEPVSDLPWVIDSTVEGSEQVALRSAVIDHGGTSSLTVYVTGPGTVFFRWKVSSQQNRDLLQFRVDGETQFNISGDIDWETRSHELGEGTHRLDWVYTKNASGSQGDDAGYLDSIYLSNGLSALSALTYFPDAQETGNGWFYAPGLGFIWGDGFRWVYHEFQGWWYLNEGGGDGFWVYDLGFGWIYIEPGLYPFLFSAQESVWVYYLEGTQNPRQFLDGSRLIEVP